MGKRNNIRKTARNTKATASAVRAQAADASRRHAEEQAYRYETDPVFRAYTDKRESDEAADAALKSQRRMEFWLRFLEVLLTPVLWPLRRLTGHHLRMVDLTPDRRRELNISVGIAVGVVVVMLVGATLR